MSPTFAQELASFTALLRLDETPPEVARATKRHLADTVACAIAASAVAGAPAIKIVTAQAQLERARPEASIVGQSWKTSARAAALANCTMARYLDANDIYMPPGGSLSGSGHFSDASFAILAVAERTGASGAETLEALIASYEVQAALADSLPWLDAGFHTVSQVTTAAALGAGRLMGLDPAKLTDAASLAVTTGMFVQSWLRPDVRVPSLKGGAPGLAAERGILCAELAALGFSSPVDALETLFEHFGGERTSTLGRDRLGQDWTLTRNAIKPAPAQIYTQAIIQCAEQLYADGLRLPDLDRLTVRSNEGASGRVQGSPAAFRPGSREAADHSTPFVVAMTLRDGGVTLDSFAGDPWLDRDVLGAMGRMTVVIDEGWERGLNDDGLLGGEIEAWDRSGRIYHAEIQQFRGHPDNPLSDVELIAKLESFVEARPHLGLDSGAQLLRTCMDLEGCATIEPLARFWDPAVSRTGQSSL